MNRTHRANFNHGELERQYRDFLLALLVDRLGGSVVVTNQEIVEGRTLDLRETQDYLGGTRTISTIKPPEIIEGHVASARQLGDGQTPNLVIIEPNDAP